MTKETFEAKMLELKNVLDEGITGREGYGYVLLISGLDKEKLVLYNDVIHNQHPNKLMTFVSNFMKILHQLIGSKN